MNGRGRLLRALLLALALAVFFVPGSVYAEGDESGNEDWHVIPIDTIGDCDRLFSDGDLSFRICDAEIPEGMTIDDIKVGVQKDGNWMEADGMYSIQPGEGDNELIVTLDGAAVKAAGVNDHDWLMVSVLLDRPIDEEEIEVLWSAVHDFEFREPDVEYWLQDDRDILPGWDGSIDGRGRVRVENAEHPWGDEWDFDIDEITLDDPDNIFEDKHPDGDDNSQWYYYRAYNLDRARYGTAVFTLKYKDLDGNVQNKDIKVNVTKDVYGCNIHSSDGRYQGMPGEELELFANASHEYYDSEGNYQNNTDGLTYEWKIEEGEEFATVDSDDSEPGRAVLRFKDLEEGHDGIDEHIRVSVKVFDGIDDEGNPSEVAFNDAHFAVRSNYTEIWPVEMNRWLQIGASIEDQKFEVREYNLFGTPEQGYNDKGFKSVTGDDGISFEWNGFDENCISITDSNGNPVPRDDIAEGDTFTINRLRDWGTDFNLKAMWKENGEDRECWQHYNLDGIECRIEDREHDKDIYTDSAEAPSVVFDTYLGENWQDRLDVVVTVGLWNNNNWTEIYENNFLKKYYTVEMTDEEVKVSLADSFFRDIDDYTDIRIFAEVYRKGAERNEENRLSDNDSWLHIKPARIDYEMQKDCDLLAARDEVNINRFNDVEVQNTQFPDNERFRYEVTDVQIISEDPETPGKHVIRQFRKDYRDGDQSSDDYWWHMEAATSGTARIKVTYNDPAELGGEEGKTYEFTITVTEDVYDVWIDSVNGVDRGRPGEKIELVANAIHRTKQGDSSEGITYEWKVINGISFADVVQDGNDPSKAVITLKLPEDFNTEHGYWEDIDVECIIYDGVDAYNNPIKRNQNIRRLNITDSYTVLCPAQIDGIEDLAVGDSVKISPELRSYPGSGGNDYDVLDPEGLTYEWYYDSNAVSITDENDNPVGNFDDNDNYIGSTDQQEFTIKRLREWGQDFELRVYWRDGDEDREEGTHFRFDWTDCGVYHREHDIEICSDSHVVPEVVFDMDFGQDWQNRIDLDIEVGICNNNQWDEEYVEGNDYTVRKDDNEVGITLSEDQFRNFNNHKDVRFRINAYVKGMPKDDDHKLSETDAWFHIYEKEVTYFPWEHFDLAIGDYHTIDKISGAMVRDNDHPDGAFVDFEVTGVTFENNEGNNGGKAMKLTEPSETSRAWVLEAVGIGNADVKIDYEDIDGNAASFVLHYHIREGVYWVDVTNEDNIHQATPGSTVGLMAAVTLHQENDNNTDITQRDDLIYDWTITDGGEFAVITKDPSKPYKAEVAFRNSDDQRIDEFVRAELVVSEPDGDDPEGSTHEIGRCDYEFRFVNEYDGIFGVELDPYMKVGEPVTITPEIRHYPSDAAAGYDIVSDAEITWNYDKDAVSITEQNGSYVIKRIRKCDTRVGLKAEWEDADGYERSAEDWFRFDKNVECAHNWGDGEVTQNNSCNDPGVRTFTCEYCGETKTEDIPAAHKLIKTDAVPATCTKTGVKAYWTCSICGKLFSDENGKTEITEIESVPAAGHQPGAAVKEKVVAASYAKGGSYDEVVYCKVCHAALKRTHKTTAKLAVKNGMAVTVGGSKYIVLSATGKTVALTKAKNMKTFTVPDTVNVYGTTYKVVQVNSKAFIGKAIKNVVIGKNVKVLKAGAFTSSGVKTVTLKTQLLKKAKIKGCMKKSKVKTVKIKISKKLNAKFVKKYKKIFKKSVAGVKVTVK